MQTHLKNIFTQEAEGKHQKLLAGSQVTRLTALNRITKGLMAALEGG